MAIKTLPLPIIDTTSIGGLMYDDQTGMVYDIAIIQPSDNRPFYFACLKNDGTRYQVPTVDGSMVLDVSTNGLLVDPATGTMDNFGIEGGTL